MMRVMIAAAGFAALSFGAASAADGDAEFYARQLAALHAVTSFRVDVTTPQLTSSSVNLASPVRTAAIVHDASGTREVRQIGTIVYTRTNGGPWTAATAGAPRDTFVSGVIPANAGTAELLADRVENGEVVGVERVSGLHADGALFAGGPMMCSFEKTTLLVRRCTSGAGTIVYSHYNDPANRVTAPEMQPAGS